MQLMFDLDSGEIVDPVSSEKEIYEKLNQYKSKCKHDVKMKSFKNEYVTYCTKCGKVLSTRRKREKSC